MARTPHLSPADGHPAPVASIHLFDEVFFHGHTAVVLRLLPVELAALLGHVRHLEGTLGLGWSSCCLGRVVT